jgi:hypothetical protein
MMNIYKPGVEKRADGQGAYAVMLTADRERLRVPEECSKSKIVSLETWVPLPIMRDYSVKGNLNKPLGDRAGIDAYLDPMLLGKRALEVLLPHIASLGQVLPLVFEEAPYSFFNVTNIVDALDETRTEFYRFPSSGRIGGVERYAFKPEAVRDQWLFKTPQLRTGFVFVTDRFVELVKTAGLTGFEFTLVWSDETADSAQAA